MADDARPFDLVLFGATGFTGGLTADYLAASSPPGSRWAIAGRNPDKLERVRQRLQAEAPDSVEVGVVRADVTDAASLAELARATRVIATTVGPYVNYGEPLVRACAEAGTDYLDLTGEPEFVDRMYVAHHARAVETGARLIHCCGFDSIPHDLGVLYTVGQLPGGVPLEVEGFVRAEAQFSAGTYHSAVTGFSRPKQNVDAARERKRVEPRAADRSVRGVRKRPHREPAIEGHWAVPMPTIDPQIVLRSARALDAYGPAFSYGHYADVKSLRYAAGGAAAVGGAFLGAQIPPVKRFMLGRLESGQGPSEERRARSWFRVRFLGSGGGRQVVTQVSGGDPGYTETSKMLAEATLAVAHDELPDMAGQLTTAAAIGQPLIDRLEAAGISFEVLDAGA